MEHFRDQLKKPPKQYRPSPFWSWNEKLDVEETVRQVGEMDDAGIGGFFMHARGGLQTAYLSQDWYDNITAATDEGVRRGMHAWGYDENGWPSGFGGGLVNGMGEAYQQKYLRCETTALPKDTPHTVGNVSVNGQNRHFYYEVNPFYVDTLDPEVTDAFLKSTHAAYQREMGEKFTRMDGFFTDEPQVSRNGIPWSLTMEQAYRDAYGEELLPLLPGLFEDVPDCARVRYRFWKLVRDLFAENFMGRIGDWCRRNGSRLTGHMVLEEGYYSHILANGCCMPPYEYMDIPGMDHLGRSLASIQTEMQLSSVANQLGKKQILSETFALSGWNVSFEDLRRIYEHQMVHGINYLCQHLEGYSLRGIRKRDYPASLFKHQPWWRHYRTFNDMVSRIGMLIAEGRVEVPILVLHTVETGWTLMKDGVSLPANDCCDRMLETMESLEADQLQYHLGDGRLMERHARVENGRLILGTQSYSVVIVPPSDCFGRQTFALLRQFKAQGGTLIFTEKQPTMIDGEPSDKWLSLTAGCPVVYHKDVAAAVPETARALTVEYATADRLAEPVLTTLRRFDDEKMTMVYLVNPCDVRHALTVTVAGGSMTRFDPLTGEEQPADWQAQDGKLTARLTLPENGSAVLFVYDDATHPAKAADIVPEDDTLREKCRGAWNITRKDPNALTLDYCDVAFDGQPAGKNVPISDVQEMACAFGRRVKTELTFRFTVRQKAFTDCRLVLETPEIFTVTVNGQPVPNVPEGHYFDRSFRTLPIFPYVRQGENEIRLVCDFEQSAAVYENLKKSLEFESEKNKLSYDMELEAVYLIGDFGVYSDVPFIPCERRGLRLDGGFALDAATDTVLPGALAPQGYPFFAGTMTFTKTVTLTAEEAASAQFALDRLCSNVTEVTVNGQPAGKLLWHPYRLNVAPLCHAGENEIGVTVTGNLRNLLGPFHLKEGESYGVGPSSFFHHSPVWLHGDNPNWDDRYCFVEYGLFF